LKRDKTSPEKDRASAGFAERWSRMKRAAAAPAAPEPETQAEAVPAKVEPAEDERPDDEVLADLGLPDPEALEPGSDFSAFMAKAVPARIRNRALRRLWLSNPVLANVDGLVDYGGDFTDSAMVIEHLQTAYQVGRGFMDRITEMAEETGPEEAADRESGADEPEANEETKAAATDGAGAEPAARSGEEDALETLMAARPVPVSAPSRRMRFRLAEE